MPVLIPVDLDTLAEHKPSIWASLRWRMSRIWYHVTRGVLHWWQRRTRGYGDDELWSLDHTIAKFVLPRFKAFRKDERGLMARCSEEADWESGQDEIEWMLTQMAHDDWPSNVRFEDGERLNKAARLFGERLMRLWT